MPTHGRENPGCVARGFLLPGFKILLGMGLPSGKVAKGYLTERGLTMGKLSGLCIFLGADQSGRLSWVTYGDGQIRVYPRGGVPDLFKDIPPTTSPAPVLALVKERREDADGLVIPVSLALEWGLAKPEDFAEI